MSTSAFRAVRELRGEDSRPGTAAGGRPGTSSGNRPSNSAGSSEEQAAAAATIDGLRKELEEAQLALEKEKRNSRSLEQYLRETNEGKDAELALAGSETRAAQQALLKSESHAQSLEELYKNQVAKLVSTVERLQGKGATPKDAEESFSEVLREEMKTMQQAYQLKLEKAQTELAQRSADFARQMRALQDQLTEEKRRSENMAEKMTLLRNAPPQSPNAASTTISTSNLGKPNSTSSVPSSATSSKTPSGGLSARNGASSATATGTKPATKPVVKK